MKRKEEYMDAKGRIEWIDFAKGIAMLCVILGHLGSDLANRVVFGFHLTVFFLLGGYTLKPAGFGGEFLATQFRKLMVPYFYTCLFVLLFDVANSVLIDKDASILTITEIAGRDLASFFYASGSIKTFGPAQMGRYIGAIWFLPAMFFASVFVQWIINRVKDPKKQYAVLLLASVESYLLSKFIWLPFSIQPGIMCAFLLLAGRDIRRYEIIKKMKAGHCLLLSAIAVFGICGEYTRIYFVTCTLQDWIISWIVTISMSLLLMKFAQISETAMTGKENIRAGILAVMGRMRLVGAVVVYIGRNSLFYLCVHLLEMNTMFYYQDWLLAKMGIAEGFYTGAKFGLKLVMITMIVKGVQILRRTEGYARQRESQVLSSVYQSGGGRVGYNKNRDVAVDIEKGILMIAMLAGHVTINPGLRRIIYSFHLAAFVVLSGYFYRKGRGLKNTLRGLFRTFLIPYGIFCAVHFAISWTGNPEHGVLYYMKQYLFGMSFSKNLWQDVPSVGPVYFILLLLLVWLFYYGTDQALCYAAKKRKAKTGKWEAVLYRMLAAIGLSVVGMYLGKAGWWLPWSADAALYCVLFYWAGIQLKEYHIPERCSDNPYLYFFLAPVWAYAIYEGNMSIAGRDYAPYGIIIAGALSAVLLLYMLSRYLRDHWSPYIVWFLALTGESSVCILLIHTLFNRRIGDFYTRWFHPEYIYHMVASNGTQILIGIMIWMLIKIYKRKDRKVFRKTA